MISIKPNPFNDRFTAECIVSDAGIIDFTLTDISGNVIRKESAVATNGLNNISVGGLSDIPKGTYFLTMGMGAEKISTVRVMK